VPLEYGSRFLKDFLYTIYQPHPLYPLGSALKGKSLKEKEKYRFLEGLRPFNIPLIMAIIYS